MKHLTPEDLSALLDGAAAPSRRAEMESHLAGCEACRAELAALAAQDLELRQSLEFDPGDAYFASFAERVRARIDAGDTDTAREPEGARRGFMAWLLGPAGLRWAGATAALLVAVGVVFTLQREGRFLPARSTYQDRAAQTAPVQPEAAMESAPAPSAKAAPNPAAMSAPAPSSDGGATNDNLAQTAPAPAGKRAEQEIASPGRMKEARRTAEGDEVPVATNRAFTPPPAASGAPSQKSVKQQAAPLTAGGVASAPPPAASAEQSRALARDERAAKDAQRADDAAKSVAPGTAFKLEAQELTAEAAQLCGTVRDASGRPVPHATVVVTGSKASAVTGSDGRFCLPSQTGTATLAVYALGFHPARQTVEVKSGKQETELAIVPVQVLETGWLGYKSTPERTGRGLLELSQGDAFTTWPAGARELAREVDLRTREAAGRRSAAGLDDATVDWGRVVGMLAGRPEQTLAREHQADAAYRAWEIEPTNARLQAAGTALDRYLEHAPKGAARDLATQRRAKLRAR